jgi:NADH-quinone oxidoreductase subunit N
MNSLLILQGISPLIAGVLCIVSEIVFKKNIKYNLCVILACIGTASSIIFSFINWSIWGQKNLKGTVIASGHIVVDPFGLIVSTVLSLFTFVVILVLINTDNNNNDAFKKDGNKIKNTLIYPLILFSLTGGIFLVSTNDFLTVFVALELMSIPLYLMIVQGKKSYTTDGLPIESSLKYFILGSVSSAIFLFGCAFLYGGTGSIYISEMSGTITPNGLDFISYVGIIFVLIGIFFKLGAVPFHQWVADVYQGAPMPVTAYFASVVKIAATALLIRISYTIVAFMQIKFIYVIIMVLTIVIGTLLAVAQKNLKRLFAYSSINHVGFILIGVMAFSVAGITSSLFYVITYSISAIGVFSILWIIRKNISDYSNIDASTETDATIIDSTADNALVADSVVLEAPIVKKKLQLVTTLDDLRGFGHSHPLYAICLSIFVLSFAGFPLTAGFIAKFRVLTSCSNILIIMLAIIFSAIAIFFYAKVIYSMFFLKPVVGKPATVIKSDIVPLIIIVLLAVLIIVLGIYPNLLIAILQKSAFILI